MAKLQEARSRWQLGPGLGSLLFVLLIPFVVLGLLVLAANVYGLLRYDPSYFTPEYREKYGELPAVARALELALQTGNPPLLAELQGLRWPGRFRMSETICFVKLWGQAGPYVTYLYVDMHSYERHEHHFEQVQGRWVVAPEDVRYVLYSGEWRAVFFPAALAWWALGLATLAFLWLLRHSASLRSRLLGP